MLKRVILGLSLLSTSYFSQAGLIVSESPITGADMAGIEVTAFFGNGGSETKTWAIDTQDGTVDFGEGFSGGVGLPDPDLQSWSLRQQGFTIGGISPADGSVLGVWTLSNNSVDSGIVGFEIDGLVANIAFDIDSNSEVTPNSGFGVAFVTPTLNTLYSYTEQVNPAYGDLFGTLSVTLDQQSPLLVGEQLVFVADTEKLAVPEPAGIAMLLSGLLFVAARTRRLK